MIESRQPLPERLEPGAVSHPEIVRRPVRRTAPTSCRLRYQAVAQRGRRHPVVVGAFFLTRAVERSGLATAYTVGLGIEAILVVTVAVGLLGERPSLTRLIGVVLIIVGVAGVRLG